MPLKHSVPPVGVDVFLAGNDNIATGLIALSAAESLTDELAMYLLEAVPVSHPSALVRGLRMCGFVSERNDEWCLTSPVRHYLMSHLISRSDLADEMHGRLFAIARSSLPASDFSHLPGYLMSGPGRAYHASALAREEGLFEYSQLGLHGTPGQQWLGAQLAREQQDFGLLPTQAMEIDFLQGMVYYREGRNDEAEECLKAVANVDKFGARVEVAIALHIVGRLEARRMRSISAEKKLRQSLEVLAELGDRSGRAQVLHTLGQLIGRDKKRRRESEQVLRESLDLTRRLANLTGESQVLHTLGNLLGRNKRRAEEAERLLRRSLELSDRDQSASHRAWVLHTLGQLIGRDRKRTVEAEAMLRESLDSRGPGLGGNDEAQVLHTLGQLIGRDRGRQAEAEDLIRRSLEIGEKARNLVHQAQVLRTLGRVVALYDKDEALRLFDRSLIINRQISHAEGIRLVEDEIRRLRNRP